MGKVKSIRLKDSERLSLEAGFRNGSSHCFRMRCRAVLLKSAGFSSKAIGLQTEMLHVLRQLLGKTFFNRKASVAYRPAPGVARKPIMDCTDEQVVRKAIRTGQTEREQSQGKPGRQATPGKESERPDVQVFFISIGAKYISELK